MNLKLQVKSIITLYNRIIKLYNYQDVAECIDYFFAVARAILANDFFFPILTITLDQVSDKY